MGSKLYVANLSFETTAEDLTSAFGNYGYVTKSVIEKDKETDRSRGFGFVTMSTTQEAEAAIDGLDHQDLRGKPLKVNIARR
ncbi:RNA-binding domain-containing protein [Aspergillus pseudodeflectus]|uniref:RNA-binding domain-containing protein n=1 Tax=Aspergillus pseudodeflectus TaxID=176178 RepID=A0ABR4JTA9_9EURO